MRVLKSNGGPIKPVKKTPSTSDDADFMRRWMQSDDYRRSTGGRALVYSEMGMEESPEYERIGFAEDQLRYVDADPGGDRGLAGVSYPEREATFIDLRQPVRGTEVRSDYPFVATHELSHTLGEPVALTTSNGFADRRTKLDTRFVGGRPEVRYEDSWEPDPETGEFKRVSNPYYYYEAGEDFENVRPEIRDVLMGKHRLDHEYEQKSPSDRTTYLDYINEPTEISARLRSLTKKMQDLNIKDPNDYEKGYTLDFDDVLLGAFGMYDPEAIDLLRAIGLYVVEDGDLIYLEDREDEARKLFNTYISGKL